MEGKAFSVENSAEKEHVCRNKVYYLQEMTLAYSNGLHISWCSLSKALIKQSPFVSYLAIVNVNTKLKQSAMLYCSGENIQALLVW